MNARCGAIENLLQPLSVEEFFAGYWEQKPLYVKREVAGYYSAVLATDDIETLLSTRDLYYPVVQLTQSGQHLDPDLYCDDNRQIKPYRLIQQHKEGATIVLSQGHRLLPAVGEYCRQLHAALQWRCQANVYLSPPGKQGFNSHYDTHDVFVMQVSGSKTFTFYSPGVDLPFCEDTYDPQQNVSNSKDDEITLNAGDTLYIPRGMVHDAKAHNDEPSLHITVGVYPVVVRDVLQEVIQVAAERDVDYRKSLSPGFWQYPQTSSEEYSDRIRTLLGAAFSVDNLDEAMSRLRDEAAISGLQDCSGLLGESPGTTAAETRYSVIDHRLLNWQRYDDKLVVRALGQVVEFMEPMSTAVEWVIKQRDFDANSLPGLDSEQKSELIHHLLRERLIEKECTQGRAR